MIAGETAEYLADFGQSAAFRHGDAKQRQLFRLQHLSEQARREAMQRGERIEGWITDDGVQRIGALAGPPRGQGLEQDFLALEAGVERRLRSARPAGDVEHGRAMEAFFRENRKGGAENLLVPGIGSPLGRNRRGWRLTGLRT